MTVPALNKAIAERRFKQAFFFINSGMNINSRNQEGNTALLQICDVLPEQLAVLIAKALIQNGAKIEMSNNQGRNALMTAILSEREQLVALLLQVAGNLNVNAKDKDGNTALFHAATVGNFDILRKVVRVHRKFRLSVDIANNAGITPLIQASKKGHLLCAQHLLSEGKASKEIRDDAHWKTAREWVKGVESRWLQTRLQRENTQTEGKEKRAKSSRPSIIRTSATEGFRRPTTAPQESHTESRQTRRSQKDELSVLFKIYQCQLSPSYREGPRTTAKDRDVESGSVKSEQDKDSSERDSLSSRPLLTRRKSSSLKTKGQDVIRNQKRASMNASTSLGFCSGRRSSKSFPGPDVDNAAFMRQISALRLGQGRAGAGYPRPPTRSRSVMPAIRLKAITEIEHNNEIQNARDNYMQSKD